MSLALELLHNPMVQGLVAKCLMDVVKELLKEVDASGVAEKNEKWLHPASVVLSLVVTALNLAMTGHLSNLDLSSVKELVLTFLGTKAAGTKTLRDLTCKAKTSLKQS